MPLSRPAFAALASALLALAGPLAPEAAAQPTRSPLVRFEATVVDADDGTPLPGATAQLEGSDRGDAADTNGRLALTLGELPAAVVVRFVGYAPNTITLTQADVRDGVIARVIRLSPAPFVMGEVAVSAEPPGERIWRRVLARKAALSGAVGGYAAEVYTRLLLLRDGWLDVRPTPIRISESLSNVAWRPRVGLFEEVVARRRRPDGGPFKWADQGPVPDILFEDWVTLDGQRIMGLGHPAALDNYAFRLGETVEVDGMRMLELAVVPRSGGLLAGRVRVVDSLFVVAEASLRAGRVPSGVGIQGFSAEHRWRYAPVWAGNAVRDSLWLPVEYEREGTVDAGVVGQNIPIVRFRQRSRVGAHRVGAGGADVTWTDRFRSPRGVYNGTDVYRLARQAMPMDSLEAKADSSAVLGRVTLKEMLRPQEGLAISLFGISASTLLRFSVEGEDDP